MMLPTDRTESGSILDVSAPLTWRVHLLRRRPERLPALVMALFIGTACVWLLFGRLLPVVAAVVVLLGAAAEYLLPTSYRIAADGVEAQSMVSSLRISWRDARRCVPDAQGLIVTPLPVASRLDRFRGVLLRFAPTGAPGDRASVYEAIAYFAPEMELPADRERAPAPPAIEPEQEAPAVGGRT